jgi:hypothetical protein
MGIRLISPAEWSRERGVSKAYVSKLVKTGKVLLVDGKIDPEDAARRLDSTQDLIKRAGNRLTELTSAADPDAQDRRADETEAKNLPDQLLRARIKREREEGSLKELERKRREGELVDAEEVREEQLRRASDEREALMNWPPRIAAQMAAELGVKEHFLLQTLRKYIRQHLAERSSQPIEG